MTLSFAWRNIWRNKRRTAVILTAIVIGIWAMIFLGSIMVGLNQQMIDNAVNNLTGDIKITAKGYRSDPTVDNSMKDPDPVFTLLKKVCPEGSRFAGRIRVNGIISTARQSAGVTIVGIDPKQEQGVSFIADSIVGGRQLKPDDRMGIVVGRAILPKLETGLKRKVVLMSQSTKGDIASRAFRISGLFGAEMEATEKGLVFISLPAARSMLKLGDGLSEISVSLPPDTDPYPVLERIRKGLPKGLSAEAWPELLPFIKAYNEMNQSFTFIWYLVVFTAMGFGIVNTILMAVYERIREFGLMKALGMKPRQILSEVLSEACFLLILGMILGNLLGAATVWLVGLNGIDLSAFAQGSEFAGMPRHIWPLLRLGDVVTANLVVLLLGTLVSAYPAAKAARFTPVEALGHT